MEFTCRSERFESRRKYYWLGMGIVRYVQQLNVCVLDCASIAALTALAHFKRPDVTTTGDEFIIHTHSEKDPIPIVLHHYPVCISYAIFNNGYSAGIFFL